MLPGFIGIGLSFVPHPRHLAMFDIVTLSLVILIVGAGIRLMYSRIARPGETGWTINIARYAGTVIAMLILFPAHPEFASVVIAIIAFGDGSATLCGLLWGKHHLPWNSHKTWEGFLAFVVCSLPLATLAYWLEADPTPSLPAALLCALSASLFGQIAESLPLKSSDNLRVGVAAAAGVLFAHMFVLGSDL